MKKFYAIYRTPVTVIEQWMQKSEEERKPMEAKMQSDWKAWQMEHADMIVETGALGKSQRVTSSGVAAGKNDLMMYTIVNAESAEAAAQIFVGHPHLQIPESSIEVMEANMLPGMN